MDDVDHEMKGIIQEYKLQLNQLKEKNQCLKNGVHTKTEELNTLVNEYKSKTNRLTIENE